MDNEYDSVLPQLAEAISADIELNYQRFKSRWDTKDMDMEYCASSRCRTMSDIFGFVFPKKFPMFEVYKAVTARPEIRENYRITIELGLWLIIKRLDIPVGSKVRTGCSVQQVDEPQAISGNTLVPTFAL